MGNIYLFFRDKPGWDVLRQLEVYENGKRLRYSPGLIKDNYGGLSEVALNLEEFKEFEITKEEFEGAWQS